MKTCVSHQHTIRNSLSLSLWRHWIDARLALHINWSTESSIACCRSHTQCQGYFPAVAPQDRTSQITLLLGNTCWLLARVRSRRERVDACPSRREKEIISFYFLFFLLALNGSKRRLAARNVTQGRSSHRRLLAEQAPALASRKATANFRSEIFVCPE